MSAKRTGLGRGLDALLGDAVVTANPTGIETSKAPDNELRLISVDLMRRGTYQPRQDMHQDSLEDLADSIRAQGVIQPIVVRPLPTLDPSGAKRYEIVAGERRWRAAQIAGLDKVPVVVRDMPDSTAIAVAIIENIQREDLNPLEEAHALRRLIDEFDLTHQDVADAIGRNRPRSHQTPQLGSTNLKEFQHLRGGHQLYVSHCAPSHPLRLMPLVLPRTHSASTRRSSSNGGRTPN